MNDLQELRGRIDEIDEQIVKLYEQRMDVCEEIATVKIQTGKKVFDKEREKSKIEALTAMAGKERDRFGIGELFRLIMSTSRKMQYHLLAKSGAAGRLPFIAVDDIEKTGIRVVFQGVEGAYSHAAMCRFFGDDVNAFHVDGFRDAIEAIAEGAADYAVLPIENSSAGIVGDNYDLLVDFENYIVAEQVIKCEHVLMGVPGASLSGIRRVLSHPQALAQCAPYLEGHPEWEQVSFANTALAAKKVAEDKDPSAAAIGSAFAAKRFGLDILADQVYYNEANSTRFIIVTNQRIFRRDAQKISICFELPHRSGSLYSILSHLIYNNVNMTRIESRPILGRSWEYRFFIAFDGNLSSSSVKNALRGIREEAISMKILGNY